MKTLFSNQRSEAKLSSIAYPIAQRHYRRREIRLRFTTFSTKETLENTFRRRNLGIPGILPSGEGSTVPMWGETRRRRNCGQGIRVGREKPNRLGRSWGRWNRGEGNSKNEKGMVWGGKRWRETMSMALGFFFFLFFFLVLLFWARILDFENFGEHASEREVSLSVERERGGANCFFCRLMPRQQRKSGALDSMVQDAWMTINSWGSG